VIKRASWVGKGSPTLEGSKG